MWMSNPHPFSFTQDDPRPPCWISNLVFRVCVTWITLSVSNLSTPQICAFQARMRAGMVAEWRPHLPYGYLCFSMPIERARTGRLIMGPAVTVVISYCNKPTCRRVPVYSGRLCNVLTVILVSGKVYQIRVVWLVSSDGPSITG